MRASDAEREAIAAQLREHYASGRLTLEELNDRLDAAFAAKTHGGLRALMTDLPSLPATGPLGGAGSSGPGTGASGNRSSGNRSSGNRGSWHARAGVGASRTLAGLLTSASVICALLALGMLGVFGIGAARPLGVILVLAGLAFLRRLLFRRRRVRHPGHGGPRRRW
jgi:hypothetical protein